MAEAAEFEAALEGALAHTGGGEEAGADGGDRGAGVITVASQPS